MTLSDEHTARGVWPEIRLGSLHMPGCSSGDRLTRVLYLQLKPTRQTQQTVLCHWGQFNSVWDFSKSLLRGLMHEVDQKTNCLMTTCVPHCLRWPLLPHFWKPLRCKRSDSWVDATNPVAVEESRALTLALWGLSEPRAFGTDAIGGHWRVKQDRWMQDGHSTVCMCVFWGQIYVYYKQVWFLTPQLLLMVKTR